jgi:hypothetical protein
MRRVERTSERTSCYSPKLSSCTRVRPCPNFTASRSRCHLERGEDHGTQGGRHAVERSAVRAAQALGVFSPRSPIDDLRGRAWMIIVTTSLVSLPGRVTRRSPVIFSAQTARQWRAGTHVGGVVVIRVPRWCQRTHCRRRRKSMPTVDSTARRLLLPPPLARAPAACAWGYGVIDPARRSTAAPEHRVDAS